MVASLLRAVLVNRDDGSETLLNLPPILRSQTVEMSPDGRFVLSSAMDVEGNISLQSVRLEPGASPRQLGDIVGIIPVLTPDVRHVIYARGGGSDPAMNLYMQPLDGSENEMRPHSKRVRAVSYSRFSGRYDASVQSEVGSCAIRHSQSVAG